MDEDRRKRRPGKNRKRFGSDRRQKNRDRNMQDLIARVQEKMRDAIEPEVIEGLNAFERRLVHRHFDHNPDVQTRTYRQGNKFTLYVYPVGNLERLAQEKAHEVLETGNPVDLPPMGSYERYVVHTCLKGIDGVETSSQGEGKERHVQIVSKQFGRTLKRIAKKIKLF